MTAVSRLGCSDWSAPWLTGWQVPPSWAFTQDPLGLSLVLAFERYERIYPHTDIVLIEPDQRDATLFFANTFSYRQRRELAEHAYQQTRQMLRDRQAQLAPKLQRHGIRIDQAALDDTGRHLLRPVPPAADRPTTRAVEQLHATLDQLQQQLSRRPARA